MIPYKPPSLNGDAFNCTHCRAYATQGWGSVSRVISNASYGQVPNLRQCTCSHCEGFSIWQGERMVFPLASDSPPPATDLPTNITADYNEARDILPLSSCGSAALLRLCIQKLCGELGEDGKNFNADIKSLVAKGLPVQIQQSLDIVRVVGNNAVHPGQMDLRGSVETARKLFGLVNLIVEVMITQPKHVQQMYNSMVPQSQRDAIANRDTP
ncbi:MAG: DUF4145 domain-containing protein [Pirellula sp.]|nr:DUF4145 domain-containing protein [Pirellula sp.]